ncbi:MAG TPA: hypothetical protein VF453_05495 [Burkholderiaceae bacterium]
MTALDRPLRRAGRAAILLAMGAACAPAGAMAVKYQCIGYRPLTAELTPRDGHVQFEGHDWRLRRVAAGGGQARYVGREVTITAKQRELTLVHGDETLRCVLLSDAVQEFAPHPPGAASAASAPQR